MSTPTVTFTGQSGKKYEFHVYSRETTFYDLGGVYIFSERDFSKKAYSLIRRSNTLL